VLRTKPESVAPAVDRWQTSRTETASRSVHPFLHGSPVYPHTDTQTTERATRVAVVRLYAMLACMRCGLIIIGRIYLCRECCSRCRFQPYDCAIIRFAEYCRFSPPSDFVNGHVSSMYVVHGRSLVTVTER